MNKQIEELMLTIPQTIVAYDQNPRGQHLYGEQRQQIAEAVYDAGYRKIIPDKADSLNQEVNSLQDKVEIERLKAENKLLLDLLDSKHFSYQTTSGKKYSVFNTVRKQFAEELKERSYINNYCTEVVEVKKIDELLKEYQNNEH